MTALEITGVLIGQYRKCSTLGLMTILGRVVLYKVCKAILTLELALTFLSVWQGGKIQRILYKYHDNDMITDEIL